MTHPIRLVLALHNHQPVGNFDHVMEEAFRDSYAPFLDVFESYPDLRLALHTSGSLMEWLDQRHPEYIDRLAEFVRQGRIEIIGGAYYEPILGMLTSVDRVGQIMRYSEWLQNRLGAKVRGMWIPERVWEPSMARDIAAAGIEYTILDDFHFKNAGLIPDQLHGYYVTEDEGHLLFVFPGSEPLRYAIPFRDPQETIDYLHGIADRQPGAVVVFGDDGEKFGAWPGTKKHVYDDGWLRRFFDAISANRDWLRVCTLAEAVDELPPAGKVYLPDSSYREMTEWVLPVERLLEYVTVRHEMEHDPRWPRLSQFVRGGFWRNFKVRYEEANEMYSRMMRVSRRLREARQEGRYGEALRNAERELHRGQCNCAYWHGAFGGVYLPHLRNAVYRHLIQADYWLDAACGRADTWVDAASEDFDFDARREVELSSDRFSVFLSPARGGMIYELDVRAIRHNLLATMNRRREAYHEQICDASSAGKGIASITSQVIFKQEGLDRHLVYDSYPRKSLLEHFWDDGTTVEDAAAGRAVERGDFLQGVYEAKIRRSEGRIQVQMSRDGTAFGQALRVTKGVTLEAGSDQIEIAYLLEGLPQGRDIPFAVELNFAGLPAGADDRYFHDAGHRRLGQLGSRLDLDPSSDLSLTDEWLGVDVGISLSKPASLWTFPIQTVSGSEGGFELVHQSVAVLPRWKVRGDHQGRWTVTIVLHVDTSLAESRMERPVATARAGG
jgi:alpha-amylase/alpha-mannosidase (GH57 family)